MKTQSLPNTDSIQELARFWDTHDLTDFENELEEVTDSVFEGPRVTLLNLTSKEVKAVRTIVEGKVGREEY